MYTNLVLVHKSFVGQAGQDLVYSVKMNSTKYKYFAVGEFVFCLIDIYWHKKSD